MADLVVKRAGSLESTVPEAAAPALGIPYREYPASAVQENFFRTYATILWKHRWAAAGFLAATLLLALLYSLKMTPLYESSARIAINSTSNDALNLNQNPQATDWSWDMTRELDTQINVLRSDQLAWQVITDLQIDSRPQALGLRMAVNPERSTSPLQGSTPNPAQQSALLKAFQNNLSISKIPNTRVIEVTFLAADARTAADVVNTLCRLYTEQNFKTKFESTMQASEWLSRQLADLKLKVETSQEKLVRYQKENQILGIDEKQNIITSKLDQLNRAATDAEADRIQKESKYQLTLSGATDVIPELSSNELIQRLRERDAEVQRQIAEATTQFGPSYPKVIQLQNEQKQLASTIRIEEQKIAARLKSDYQVSVGRERMLKQSLEMQKQEANRLNEKAIEYSAMKREADTNRQLYDNLLQKLKEATVVAGLKSANNSVIDPARPANKPAKPNYPRNMLLAFVFGLTGAIGLALLLEAVDTTVRGPDDAEGVTAMTTIGMIPRIALPKASRRLDISAPLGKVYDLTVMKQPRSQTAEAFRALRTSVMLSGIGQPPKVITITSGSPKEGKTSVSLNMACVLAQSSQNVLLVDADMRRPQIHAALKMSNGSGLSSLLSGSESEQNVVRTCSVPNLSVITAGPTPPQPAELLASVRFAELLAKWREQYDHIVIDTPPVLSVTDAALVGVHSDSILLVARAGQTHKGALARTRELLSRLNLNVTGIVINAFDAKALGYYGQQYGYYGYGKKNDYYHN